ncbi:hypothetical protein [Maritalea sp.]|uniref:hypothetical protein n=1 Tax=Maritalea sp. TaxID=2003361 RepID=UPI003EF40C69
MKAREALIEITGRYCAAKKLSRSRVSTILFGSGKRLDAIVSGADLNTKTYEAALTKMDAEWPSDAVWPENIMRPPNFVGTEVSA